MNFQKSHSSNTPQLDGVLLVDKPRGCTSHDIVEFVRRRYKFAKVGHCGTLDPLATGLLMLGIGKATKVQDLLMAEDKIYAGTMKLGQTTASQDADGQVEEEKPVPAFTQAQIEEAFNKYVGDFYQTPPMVSALKQGGVPLYKLAREGKTVHREPRLITVYWYKLLGISLPHIRFEIRCTKGFYVRTYCHDIGQDMGTGAHLTELTRLQSGNFTLDRAVGWEQLQQISEVGELVPHILSLAEVSKLRRQ
ncbi:MAG: tRNA pseudouridine(55) synthase TruB [Candidatus Methylacidiphilales bacterium]|nr:tRNA pseudouridine(55) synthase TruB [Candidatus Methylacidiphilales bacterium]